MSYWDVYPTPDLLPYYPDWGTVADTDPTRRCTQISHDRDRCQVEDSSFSRTSFLIRLKRERMDEPFMKGAVSGWFMTQGGKYRHPDMVEPEVGSYNYGP